MRSEHLSCTAVPQLGILALLWTTRSPVFFLYCCYFAVYQQTCEHVAKNILFDFAGNELSNFALRI